MMESFLIYPYNWIILIVGVVLVIGAFVYINRSKNNKGIDKKEQDSDQDRNN